FHFPSGDTGPSDVKDAAVPETNSSSCVYPIDARSSGRGSAGSVISPAIGPSMVAAATFGTRGGGAVVAVGAVCFELLEHAASSSAASTTVTVAFRRRVTPSRPTRDGLARPAVA